MFRATAGGWRTRDDRPAELNARLIVCGERGSSLNRNIATTYRRYHHWPFCGYHFSSRYQGRSANHVTGTPISTRCNGAPRNETAGATGAVGDATAARARPVLAPLPSRCTVLFWTPARTVFEEALKGGLANKSKPASLSRIIDSLKWLYFYYSIRVSLISVGQRGNFLLDIILFSC